MKKIALGLFLSVVCLTLTALTPQQGAYLYQSVYIYNFTKYINWPDNSPQIIIGVMGDQEALESLKKMAARKSTAGKKFVVKNVTSPSRLDKYHIFYLTKKYDRIFPDIYRQLANKPTLLITENPRLSKKGSSINFVMVDGKLKFELDQKQVSKSGLKVSSSLVRLAIRV